MDIVNGVERQFLALQEGSAKEYEARVLQWQNGLDERRRRAQEDEKEIRDSLKKSGTDLDLFDRRAKRDADELQAFLKAARPAIANRATRSVMDQKQRALEASMLAEVCSTQIPPYAANLLVHDKRFLEGIEIVEIEGQPFNPWIFPVNPDRIKLWNKDEGDGWGCWATASGPPPTATVWFTFTPTAIPYGHKM